MSTDALTDEELKEVKQLVDLHQRFKEKSISEFQAEITEWSKRNFTSQDLIDPLLGLTEELGELNHAVLKQRQGIRKGLDPAKSQELKEDAIGDLFIYLTDFCQRNNINLYQVINKTWEQVKQRDWQKNKQNGVTS